MIKAHQIYFLKDQIPKLDPAFLPYDNSGCTVPDEREYFVFRTEYAAGRIDPNTLTGYLSWKFGEKTQISGQDFKTFCDSNSGFDVYFINPYPMEICLGNVWQQGDERHPGILELTQHIFDQINYSIELKNIPAALRHDAFCNFWVGNKKFWDSYMNFCKPIYDYIQDGLQEPYKSKLFTKADPYRTASYFAFIFERLFTTFLATHPKIKAKGYRFSPEQLRARCGDNGAILLNALYDLEDKYSDDPQPLDRDPVLSAGLNLYFLASERSFTPVARYFYNLNRRLMTYVPYKQTILGKPFIRGVAKAYLSIFRPPAMRETLPKNSL